MINPQRVRFAFVLGVLLLGTTAQATDNPYSPANGHSYRHGVVPTRETWQQMQAYAQSHPSAGGLNTLSYGGGVDGIGVTSGTPKVYLVFWGSQWGSSGTDSNGNLTFSNDTAGAAPYLQNLFKGIGTGSELWSGVMTQYCDGAVAAGATSCPTGASLVGYPSGGTLAGVWADTGSPTPTTSTAAQLGQEAVSAASHFGNTTAASNRYAQYVILSPSGTHPDGFGTSNFCAWHDWNGDVGVSSSVGDIAFTNMPYVLDLGTSCGQNFVNSGAAGTLDGFSIVNGHEYAETITDQNPPGGWTHNGGAENADECAWISSGQGASANVTTAHGTFAMQSTWSNDTNECDLSHAIVSGGGGGGGPNVNFSFTTSALTANFIDGTSGGSPPYTYAWSFGDGGSSTQANPSHTYAKQGRYSATETVTDSTGASGSATKTVSVRRH